MPIVSTNSIELFYDEFGNHSAPAILLIMGLGGQMIEWPETFCEGLSITVVIFCWHICLISESMGHHDSEIMDDGSID